MTKFRIHIFWILLYQCTYHAIGEKHVMRREMKLDHDGNFYLKWRVDFEKKTITFTAKVKTTGYVGLGVSPSPRMTGADIVIGGVSSRGNPYFDDYHALDNGAPIKDTSNDWTLVSAKEANGLTKLKFSRLLATCDDEDLEITESTQYIIWAIGESDKFAYHGPVQRGAVTVNFLDPIQDKVDLSQYEVWNILYKYNVPSEHTSLWCTLHKMPPHFNGTTAHIVAFGAILNSQMDMKHVHHAILRRCAPPSGIRSEEFFEEFINQADDCNRIPPVIPILNCLPYIYTWGFGGRVTALPENVGYAMGETGSTEYVMLQMHYNNPDRTSNITTNAGLSIYYTTKKRQMNAAVMKVGALASHQLTIPPRSKAFVAVAHCGAACTKKTLPKEGLYILSTILHTHLAGKKIVLRHFRGREELPWIARDDTYHFNYQSFRPLRDHVRFMPGDNLVIECTYNTEDRDEVSIGGVSTFNEMCSTFLWIYPYTDSFECLSYMEPVEPLLSMFGMEKVDWDGLQYADPRVLLPNSLLNKTYSSVLNSANWNDRLKKKLQKVTRYAKHTQSCRVDANGKTWFNLIRNIKYPKSDRKYEPQKSSC